VAENRPQVQPIAPPRLAAEPPAPAAGGYFAQADEAAPRVEPVPPPEDPALGEEVLPPQEDIPGVTAEEPAEEFTLEEEPPLPEAGAPQVEPVAPPEEEEFTLEEEPPLPEEELTLEDEPPLPEEGAPQVEPVAPPEEEEFTLEEEPPLPEEELTLEDEPPLPEEGAPQVEPVAPPSEEELTLEKEPSLPEEGTPQVEPVAPPEEELTLEEEPVFDQPPPEEPAPEEEVSLGGEDAAEPGTQRIPAVIDRPLEIDEGEQIEVNSFRLSGVTDRPEFDISLEGVEALLEQIRVQREGRFSIGRLQQATEEVTKYYRERGLILAQAILPVQTVSAGVVDVEVLEGTLGRILVEGNKLYGADTLRAPLAGLVGKPVVASQIESGLLRLTDYPGLAVFGIFQPGQQIGQADLVLKVQSEKRFAANMVADNQGTQSTGIVRLRNIITWNNPTDGADRLSAILQQTYQPKNQFFWRGIYRRELGLGFFAEAYLEQNAFLVGGELADRELRSRTTQQGGLIGKSFIRSRQLNLSSQLGFVRKDSVNTTRGAVSSEDRLAVLSLRIDYDSVDTRFGGLNFAYLEFSRGFNDLLGAMGDEASAQELARVRRNPSRQGGPPDNLYAEGEFNKIALSLIRLQTLREHQALLFRSEFQWSPDLLVPLEQFSVGGPDSVRAFSVAEQLFDIGAFFSLEYILDAPLIADRPAFKNRTWGEVAQLFLFFDQAAGKINEPQVTDPQGFTNYRGAGFGLRFNVPNALSGRMMWAWPLGDRHRPNNGRRPQFWTDLSYRF